jgi:uncharacterized cupin superfamily protein
VPDEWFIVNAREAASGWVERAGFGKRCLFEPEDGRFAQVGIHLPVIEPGDHSTLYHAEEAQEDFLVLRGSCTAIVEEHERSVKQWDLVHCPPGTRHVFVNEGSEPSVLLMIGARVGGGIHYPASKVALQHGAGVETEARSAKERVRRDRALAAGRPGAVLLALGAKRPDELTWNVGDTKALKVGSTPAPLGTRGSTFDSSSSSGERIRPPLQPNLPRLHGGVLRRHGLGRARARHRTARSRPGRVSRR